MPAALLFVIWAGLLFTTKLLGDPDTYWHIATGDWILRHGTVPSHDPFSFTFAGSPWTAHEWLSEVLYALAYRGAGWGGVLLLASTAFVCALAVLAAYARQTLPPLATAALVLFSFFSAVPSILARPHILALPLLAVWLTELLKAREADRAPKWWLLAVMLAWSNIHGSFLLGLAMLGAFAVEAAVIPPGGFRSAVVRWGPFCGGALVAAVLTPHGASGLLFPLTFVEMETFKIVDEWRSADFSRLTIFEILLLEALLFILWLGVRAPPFRIVLLLGLLHLALKHERHQAVFGLSACALLAEPFARALAERKVREDSQQSLAEAEPDRRQLHAASLRAPFLLAIAAASALTVVRLATPLARADDVTPAAALKAVPPSLRAAPVFNEYDFGGYLIFEKVRPYIDSRADMYGDAFVVDQHAIMQAPERRLLPALSRWGIRWTILRPQSAAVAVLDSTAWCRRLWADPVAVVHVCDPPARTGGGAASD